MSRRRQFSIHVIIVSAAIFMATPVRAQQNNFTVGTASAAPGQKATGFIEVPAGVDAATRIPVVIFRSAKPGPTLAIVSGSHGTEYASIIAVERLITTLDATKLSGTVILVPLVNILSFEQKVPHVNPIDNKSMNRFYPGKMDGTQTDRVSFLITQQVVDKSDYLIDLHGGDIPEALVPFVICRAGAESDAKRTADVARKSKEIAMVFGVPYVLTVSKPVQPTKAHRASAGGLSSYAAAAEKGIPAILAEAGGVGQMQEDQVELLVNGVRNVMTHLGMLPEDLRLKRGDRKKPEVLTKFEWVYTKRAGIWYPKIAPGDSLVVTVALRNRT